MAPTGGPRHNLTMIEVSVVFGMVLLLSAAGWAATLFTWQTLLLAGAACVAVGGALGLPTGFYYHVLLYRFLSRQGQVPNDWWLRPTRYHGRLDEAERGAMRPWFSLGGLGAAIMFLGCLIAALGVVIA